MTVRVEKDGPVTTIINDRPEARNAVDPETGDALVEAFLEFDNDPDASVAVFWGAGGAFCAGWDLKMAAELSVQPDPLSPYDYPAEGATDNVPRGPMGPTRLQLSKPVIAAINGPCAGLGLVMALFCDVRCASENAVFTTAFARRGLIAEHGIDWILPRVVGLPNALDLLLSARKLGAEEARDMGLVGKVFPHDELMGAVRSYAKELATMVSPRSMRVMKEQIYRTQDTSLSESVNRGFDEMYDSLDSDDFKEGVASYVEKRAPRFERI